MLVRTSVLFTILLIRPLPAVELATLTEENWQALAPRGKEVDGILGDMVLRNPHVVAVIARPGPHRHANMTVHHVGGCLIDYTLRGQPNDQLSAYYPGGQAFLFESGERSVDGGPWTAIDDEPCQGTRSIHLRFTGRPTTPGESDLRLTVTYELSEDVPFLSVHQTYQNPGKIARTVTPVDALRADRSFAFRLAVEEDLFTAADYWWSQCYGLWSRKAPWRIDASTLKNKRPVLEYVASGEIPSGPLAPGRSPDGEGTAKGEASLPGNHPVPEHVDIRSAAEYAASPIVRPGESIDFTTDVLVGRNRLEILEQQARQLELPLGRVRLRVKDAAGNVAGARVRVTRDGQLLGVGRTRDNGILAFASPPGIYHLVVESAPRGVKELDVTVVADERVESSVQLPQPGFVRATITDADHIPIAAKVEFQGRESTPDPFFGPDTYVWEVHNVIYSEDGTFRHAVAPGKYQVIVSHGPEYDAEFLEIEVARGKITRLDVVLPRSVDTRGWISADFHGHSSPSGDNTASQLGRVLNLLAEQIEFAPCTEHNRITTYRPHLRQLDALNRLATCCGMELTGHPLPMNHQNAFPLQMHLHHQDGGGPRTDHDPVRQIERLALWDDNSDKLVQGNHPNIMQIYADRDADGKPDEGFRKMFSWMDVIEVHPPDKILQPKAVTSAENPFGNTMFHWLQLLNLGHRIPGVVNTDAHYTFHGSGWLRNYLASPTDDPSQIKTMDVVHAAEHGHVVMTNGPFLEVRVHADERSAGPGDDLRVTDGTAELFVRVQCANWLQIDRVQVLRNGLADPELNYVKRLGADGFQAGTVQFERTIPLTFSGDCHLIVVAIGENATLGPVVGPHHAADRPVAVANPIFIDFDGDGFQPAGDLLGTPSP